MAFSEPAFTIGIEEEYWLVDRQTRNLAADPPADLVERCNAAACAEVSPEFLRSQIEIGTTPCKTVGEAAAQLRSLRRTIADIAGEAGLAPVAASTHPFAEWADQHHADKQRYNALAEELQTVVRRLLICGMHVHVGIEDADTRIDLMNQVSYFLPHLLCLSTSSPFWRGQNTGLMSYRLSVFKELPRTGLPDRFDSHSAYERHVDAMVGAGVIEDATRLWWDIRPSARFPTLEMRMSDIPTRAEDTATVAALYVCLLRMLWRLRTQNQRWRIYSGMLVAENRWRAQRYGLNGGLIDFGAGAVVPYITLLEEILDLVREDAEALDCLAEVEHAREIVARGTSAHRQVETFDAAIAGGASREEALRAVVDMLIAETVTGL
ncbi:MAG: carboxylate-amine ligase [Rhodospirillales bacterium]